MIDDNRYETLKQAGYTFPLRFNYTVMAEMRCMKGSEQISMYTALWDESEDGLDNLKERLLIQCVRDAWQHYHNKG